MTMTLTLLVVVVVRDLCVVHGVVHGGVLAHGEARRLGKIVVVVVETGVRVVGFESRRSAPDVGEVAETRDAVILSLD